MSGSELLEVVAIDGPSGSGKSSVARRVAELLGWRHLDTGSMYRAVTYWLVESGVALDDTVAIARALESLELRAGASGRVWIREREVTAQTRSAPVEARVSAVSAIPAVRAKMRELQRQEARRQPLVAEGRDMTSAVFPDARWRFYLDARPDERARRRLGDFVQAGRDADHAEVLREIEERDRLDSTRQDSPLVRVEGATYIDTTGLTADEVVARILARVEEEHAE